MSNPFKNAGGAHYTKGLFYEHDQTRMICIYTLSDEDKTVDLSAYGRGVVLLPSLRRLYVEAADPTEYSFCKTYLDGWAHWKKMFSSPTLSPHIEEWREELDISLRSANLARIMKVAETPSKESYQAQKFLTTGGWKETTEKKVGRPTKEKIKQEAEKLFTESSVHDEDFERILGKGALQ